MEITRVFEGICHLGECPLWHSQQQRLYWTDIFERRIWVYDRGSGTSEEFWQGDLQVGGFAFTRSGDLVMCADKGVFRLRAGSRGAPDGEPQLLYLFPLTAGEMFNDSTTDPAGRIFVGSLDRARRTGTLYRLEKGRPPVAVLYNVGCSNGMTFSLDQRFFFHTDSRARTITRYRYHCDTGEIDEPELFHRSPEGQGLPDGITMDSEGFIWAAFWGGSSVRRLDPKGRVVLDVRMPARQPSSVMFGGPDLDELYVTSAAQDAVDLTRGLDREGRFLGGALYRFSPGVRGRPEWPADF